jgi:hypothetical protein
MAIDVGQPESLQFKDRALPIRSSPFLMGRAQFRVVLVHPPVQGRVPAATCHGLGYGLC